MKKIPLIILALIIINAICAQEKKLKFYTEAGVQSGYGDYFNFGVNINYKKHYLGLGIETPAPLSDEVTENQIIKATTVSSAIPIYLNYKYCLRAKKLNPFVQYYMEHYYDDIMWENVSGKYFHVKTHTYRNHLGIGLQYKMGKRFYIESSYNYGFDFYKSKSISKNETSRNNSKVDTYAIRLGIGILIYKKR